MLLQGESSQLACGWVRTKNISNIYLAVEAASKMSYSGIPEFRRAIYATIIADEKILVSDKSTQ